MNTCGIALLFYLIPVLSSAFAGRSQIVLTPKGGEQFRYNDGHLRIWAMILGEPSWGKTQAYKLVAASFQMATTCLQVEP